ncbi:MFS transporter, partial [Candidatus Woesearchaeota archaeon]|nr:MFS transporter [Candidatus Woesearchaeota archaeon]
MISKTRKLKLKKNIWKFYLYRIFCSMMFVNVVYVLFLKSNGLSMTQIMVLQSIYTAMMMVMIVPFGIIADFIGRKKIIITSTVFFAAAFVILAAGSNFIHFLISEIAFAISGASWSSSRTAFFYDNLMELNQEKRFKKLFGNVLAIDSAFFAVGALIGGFLAGFGLRIPAIATVIPVSIALFVSFSFTDTKRYKHADKNYLNHLKEAAVFTAKHAKVRFFIIYSAVLFAVFYTGYMLYQPYLVDVGIPITAFGVIYALMGFAGAFGSKISHRIEEKIKEKRFLLLVLALAFVSYLGLGKVGLIIGAIFPILISFTSGIFGPAVSDYIQKHVKSHNRATVSSLNILAIEGATAALAPFIGWMADIYTIQAAFKVAAFIVVVNLFILSL